MQYEIPMTLYVTADSPVEASNLAVTFERTRESFDEPYLHLHVGTTAGIQKMYRERRVGTYDGDPDQPIFDSDLSEATLLGVVPVEDPEEHFVLCNNGVPITTR